MLMDYSDMKCHQNLRDRPKKATLAFPNKDTFDVILYYQLCIV